MKKYTLRNSFVFTVILLLGFCANVCAQNEQSEAKKTVYIEYFNRPQNLSFSQAEALRNKVIEHIQYRKRIILTNRSNWSNHDARVLKPLQKAIWIV